MNSADITPIDRARHGMRFGEFVALMASLMAVNALGIDIMLPALSVIGHEYGIAIANHQQLVIVTYVGSFGVGQLFYGPLADRYGRRPVLLAAMFVYAAMSVIAALSGSFELLLVARAFQGAAAASTRVLSVSIVRDCYAGRQMARVMSLTFMVFLAVPVMAPTLGQLILLVAPWHWIFYGLGAFSLFVALWAQLRLPETLNPADRQPINVRAIWMSTKAVTTNRYSIGYSVAGACVYGCLLGFLNSSPQIVADIFHLPQLFAFSFAVMGGMMAVAALVNSRIVERLGTRAVSHSALLALIALSIVHFLLVITGVENFATFTIFNGLTFFCFGLTGSNFGSMAMEPMGHIAGTASSIQGFISTSIGTVIGFIIGQSFSGTEIPMAIGWLLGGTAAMAIVLVVERGRLFRPHNPPPPLAQ